MAVVDRAVKICSKAKLAMEHNTILRRIIPTLRKCGLNHAAETVIYATL